MGQAWDGVRGSTKPARQKTVSGNLLEGGGWTVEGGRGGLQTDRHDVHLPSAYADLDLGLITLKIWATATTILYVLCHTLCPARECT